MFKRNRILRAVCCLLLSIALLPVTVDYNAFAAGDDSSLYVWEPQFTDMQGTTSFLNNTVGIQATGGTMTVPDSNKLKITSSENEQYKTHKEIKIQVGGNSDSDNPNTKGVTGGSGDYWSANNGFHPAADTWYKLTCKAELVSGAAATGTVVINGDAQKGKFALIGQTPTNIEYTFKQEASGGNLKINTDNSPIVNEKGEGLLIYDLKIEEVAEEQDGDLILDQGFEADTNVFGQNGTATIERSQEQKSAGAWSLKVTPSGAQNYDGVKITNSNLDSPIAPGGQYKLTAKVYSATAGTMEVRSETKDSAGGNTYGSTGTQTINLSAGSWVDVTMTVTIPSDHQSFSAIAFVDSNKTGLPFYLDEVKIEVLQSPPTPGEGPDPQDGDLILDQGFEADSNVFGQNGTATIVRSQEQKSTGAWSLKVTPSGAQNYDGVKITNSNLDSPIAPGGQYKLTAKVYSATAGTMEVRSETKDSAGGNTYGSTGTQTINLSAGSWVDVTMTITIPSDHQSFSAIAFVDSNKTGLPFYLDEVKIEILQSPPKPGEGPELQVGDLLLDQGFETATNVFGQNGDAAIERSKEQKFAGEWSLKVTPAGKQTYDGVKITNSNLLADIKPGGQYELTAKMYSATAGTIGVRSETKNVSGGDTYGSTGSASIKLSANTWADVSMTITIPEDHKSFEAIAFVDSEKKAFAFYLDEVQIEILKLPPEPEELQFTDLHEITFSNSDKTIWQAAFTANTNASLVWDTSFGKTDDFSLKGSHNAIVNDERDGGYNSTDNAIRLTFDTPLPAGKIYNISYWVYVPVEGNTGKKTLTGPGVVLNGSVMGYSGATGTTKFPSSPGTITTGVWKEVNFETPAQTTPITDIDFRFVVNAADNHPDVWYIDDVKISSASSNVKIAIWDLTLPSLKDAYKNYFPFGNILEPNEVSSDTDLTKMYKRHYNFVTAENAMKPDRFSDDGVTYSYTNADNLITWAKANSIPVHGHTLVWHTQSASWLNKDASGNPLTRSQAKANLESYINKVATHFAGKVVSWDVCNEVFTPGVNSGTSWKDALRKEDDKNDGESSYWYLAYENDANTAAGESGADYIYDAFVFARKADPNAVLFYNDFNEEYPGKREAIAQMAEELNAKWDNDTVNNPNPGRKLIEGIGMQSHFSTTNLVVANVEAAIKRFKDLGLRVVVSELDITHKDYGSANSLNGRLLTEDEQIDQAKLYAQLFEIYKKYKDDIDRVTIWAKADSQSWRGSQNPVLFDNYFEAKEAYHAVMDPTAYLIAHPVLNTDSERKTSSAIYGTPAFNGKIDSVWASVPVMNVDNRVSGTGTATAKTKAMWDKDYLYVLAEVTDPVLTAISGQSHEQDSVEFFVSETNHKAASYQAGDGQYRVNYENDQSFNIPAPDGYESEAWVTSTGYVIQAKIPFKEIVPAEGKVIGFDAQINDMVESARSVIVWSDLKAQGYSDASNWGQLTLAVPKPVKPTTPPSPSTSNDSESSSGGGTTTPSNVRTTPTATATVSNQTASVVVDISTANLEKAVTESSGNKDTKTLNLVMDVPSSAKGVANLAMTISADTLERVKDMDIDSVTITLGDVKIVLPIELIESIAGKSDTIKLEVKLLEDSKLSQQVSNLTESGQAYELNLYVSNKKHDGKFGKLVDVTLPYTIKGGQKSEHLAAYYVNSAGKLEPRSGVYNKSTGKFTFNTISFSTYIIKDRTVTFDDLNQSEWARTYIETMASKSIISGRNSTTFDPNTNITRAEFATLLVRMLGGLDSTAKSTYKDVSKDNTYYTAIASLESLGLKIAEKTPKSFSPSDNITREEMFDLMGQVLAIKGYRLSDTTTLNKFKDSGDVSGYAYENVALLVENKIIAGMGDGTLKPKNNLTRAEASTVLYMLLNK